MALKFSTSIGPDSDVLVFAHFEKFSHFTSTVFSRFLEFLDHHIAVTGKDIENS